MSLFHILYDLVVLGFFAFAIAERPDKQLDRRWRFCFALVITLAMFTAVVSTTYALILNIHI